MIKLTICYNFFLQVFWFWNHTIALYALNYSYQIYESLFPQRNKKYKKVIFLQMWGKDFKSYNSDYSELRVCISQFWEKVSELQT